MKIATIESLWRYPVKSLLGENLNKLEIDTRGILGDREFAISNTEGKFGSGKNTRRFRRIDGLFSLSAKSIVGGVSIEFPDGSELKNEDPAINKKLSQILDQNVTLTKENEISHFDDGAIHILTTASLNLLSELLPNYGIDPRRFRPNIILDSQYLDQDLLGKTLKIGETILEITHKTERCRMVTLEQSDLENKPKILKTISQQFGLDFGVYAKVQTTGVISAGDQVEIIS